MINCIKCGYWSHAAIKTDTHPIQANWYDLTETCIQTTDLHTAWTKTCNKYTKKMYHLWIYLIETTAVLATVLPLHRLTKSSIKDASFYLALLTESPVWNFWSMDCPFHSAILPLRWYEFNKSFPIIVTANHRPCQVGLMGWIRQQKVCSQLEKLNSIFIHQQTSPTPGATTLSNISPCE